MRIVATPIPDLFIVEIVTHEDERGGFARTWDPKIAKEHRFLEKFDYTCISTNIAAHTLRGMHYQKSPHDETKLVRCTKGKMFDVVIDLRPETQTFLQWFGVELSAENHKALYIPPGFAHGFLTLEPHTEVFYMIAGEFAPDAATGVRFDDPAFGIEWPAAPAVISERDKMYPDFRP